MIKTLKVAPLPKEASVKLGLRQVVAAKRNRKTNPRARLPLAMPDPTLTTNAFVEPRHLTPRFRCQRQTQQPRQERNFAHFCIPNSAWICILELLLMSVKQFFQNLSQISPASFTVKAELHICLRQLPIDDFVNA